MSAFIVNDKTINRIVSFLDSWEFGYNTKLKTEYETEFYKVKYGDLQAVGEKIRKLNIKSVGQRYGKITKEEKNYKFSYKYDMVTKAQVWNHLRCLTYQLSEGNIPNTKAYKILEKIETALAISIANDYTEGFKLEWEAKIFPCLVCRKNEGTEEVHDKEGNKGFVCESCDSKGEWPRLLEANQ